MIFKGKAAALHQIRAAAWRTNSKVPTHSLAPYGTTDQSIRCAKPEYGQRTHVLKSLG